MTYDKGYDDGFSDGCDSSLAWIHVDDPNNPPIDQEEVLVCTRSKNGFQNIDKGYWSNGRWIHRGCAEVTHWMPLPEFPREGEE